MDFVTADDVDLALPRPAAPSPTQSHGTVMVALLSGFVVLAVLLWLSIRGVGPFTVEVVTSNPTATGLTMELRITNTGSRAGHAKCGVVRLGPTGDEEAQFNFLTPERIKPHQTITETVAVPLSAGGHTGQVDC
jgi:hypothetical protein